MANPNQNILSKLDHPVIYGLGVVVAVGGFAGGWIKDETHVWIVVAAAIVGTVLWIRRKRTAQ